MKTILLTGATRGLGLAFAELFAKDTDTRLVLAVRDLDAGKALAMRLGKNVEAVLLDMASRGSIAAFLQAWTAPIDVLVNNAGLQVHGPTALSTDGVELSLAVNHLGVLQLTKGLLPLLEGGSVLTIGSGTHNPNDKVAKIFGFRGGRFTSIRTLAKGETNAKTERQAGMDRYATSKLAAMATIVELARRYPNTRFMTLDPGLMPGTGLVRTAPRVIQMAWKFVMPIAVPLIPGASTPAKSAEAGYRIVTGSHSRSGATYNHSAQISKDLWDKVNDPSFGRKVVDESLAFLNQETKVDAAA